MGFDINQKHQQNNRTSSDQMDEIIQNRHRKEGWEWVEMGEEFSPHLAHLRFFVFFTG